MVEKAIKEEIFYQYEDMQSQITNAWESTIKTKICHILNTWNLKMLYMEQQCLKNNLYVNWMEN